MNKKEELTRKLTRKINAEYILLKYVDWSEKTKTTIEQNFNQHLREYKDLIGNDFQLEKLTNKLDHWYECD